MHSVVCEGKEWIHLAEDGIQGRIFVNIIVTNRASVKGAEYLTALTALTARGSYTYILPGETHTIYAFFPQSVFMCFVWI